MVLEAVYLYIVIVYAIRIVRFKLFKAELNSCDPKAQDSGKAKRITSKAKKKRNEAYGIGIP